MKISADFDDTLLLANNQPNAEMLEIIRQHLAQGHTVIIVTSRNRHHDRRSWIKKNSPQRISVRAFIEEHCLAIEEIHYTNHKLKVDKLIELKVDLHYDNDPIETQSCEAKGIRTILL